MGHAETLNEVDDGALPAGEPAECGIESRLDREPLDVASFDGRPHRQESVPQRSSFGDSIEVARPIGHRRELLPVLPGIDQGILYGLSSSIGAELGDQRISQWSFDVSSEPSKQVWRWTIRVLPHRNLPFTP